MLHSQLTAAGPFCAALLQRTRWTDAEEAELLRLVKLYGRGTWATILEKGNDVFEGRRSQVLLRGEEGGGLCQLSVCARRVLPASPRAPLRLTTCFPPVPSTSPPPCWRQVDLKDKWRNLAKANRILPSDLQAIEVRRRRASPPALPPAPPPLPPAGGLCCCSPAHSRCTPGATACRRRRWMQGGRGGVGLRLSVEWQLSHEPSCLWNVSLLPGLQDQEQHLRKERMTKMPPGRPPRFVPPGGAKQARTGGGSTVKKSTGKGKKSAKKAQAEEEETEGELEHEDEDDTVEESGEPAFPSLSCRAGGLLLSACLSVHTAIAAVT